MGPDAPDIADLQRSTNHHSTATSRIEAAWHNLADAIINEAHQLALTAINDTATAAHRRVGNASIAANADSLGPAAALTLGATIGIVGAALLTPRRGA